MVVRLLLLLLVVVVAVAVVFKVDRHPQKQGDECELACR